MGHTVVTEFEYDDNGRVIKQTSTTLDAPPFPGKVRLPGWGDNSISAQPGGGHVETSR